MEKGMAGKKIVICGSRKIEEISTLIEKQGGTPVVRPLQGTVFSAEKEVEPDLVEFVQKGADWVVFTTGIGIETLIQFAGKLAIEENFLHRIQEARIASRGYKTNNALKKLLIQPEAVSPDGTTGGLMKALGSVDFSGKRVMIQLHGESAPVLTQFFEGQGASVQRILPYQHIEPEREMVEVFCKELLDREMDAVCFTTATQVHYLFEYGREKGIEEEMVRAFNQDILATAVGKVTLEALLDEGVQRYVVPENERMGAMIIELAKYYES